MVCQVGKKCAKTFHADHPRAARAGGRRVYRSEPAAHFSAQGVDDGTIAFTIQEATISDSVYPDLDCRRRRGDALVEVYPCSVQQMQSKRGGALPPRVTCDYL